MLENIDIKSANILLSGGAKGADTEFGKWASKSKHQIVHWTFEGHKATPRTNLYTLTKDHLVNVDPYVIRASKSLKRIFPAKSEHTNNLLRRNYYQVKWCESVYAISSFTQDNSLLKVAGGTAWACQMYVDRFLYDQESFDLCQLYVFDQTIEKWYQWLRQWREIDKPPTPFGVYAGIGTRDITTAGITAIKSLY